MNLLTYRHVSHVIPFSTFITKLSFVTTNTFHLRWWYRTDVKHMQVTAYCYRGQCQSHQSQCRLLWGSSSNTSDSRCYSTFNVRGSYAGNCGLNWNTLEYVPCSTRWAIVKSLSIVNFNEKLLLQLGYFIIRFVPRLCSIHILVK